MVYSEVPNFSEPNPDYRGQPNKGVIKVTFMTRLILTICHNSMARLPTLSYPEYNEDSPKSHGKSFLFCWLCESEYASVVSYI